MAGLSSISKEKRLSLLMRKMIGRRNARVFPEPVLETHTASFPFSSTGQLEIELLDLSWCLKVPLGLKTSNSATSSKVRTLAFLSARFRFTPCAAPRFMALYVAFNDVNFSSAALTSSALFFLFHGSFKLTFRLSIGKFRRSAYQLPCAKSTQYRYSYPFNSFCTDAK